MSIQFDIAKQIIAEHKGLRSIGRTVSFDPAENLYDRRAKQAR